MAETIGTIILAEIGATEFATATISIFGASITGAQLVGTAALIGTSIGLQYALRQNPQLPKPEDGSEAKRQAIPPRIRGYGLCRIAGYYLLYTAVSGPPADSYDVIGWHSGAVWSVQTIFLSDDVVTTTPDISFGGDNAVIDGLSDGSYAGGRCRLSIRLGRDGEDRIFFGFEPEIASTWTANHVGAGIAQLGMSLGGFNDPQTHTQVYPRGRPEPSVAALLSPIWDKRDISQSRDDPSSWRVRFCPVLQLIDYFREPDGGLGEDIDDFAPPAVLQQLMTEADLCDQLVSDGAGGAEPRYASNGFYSFDNNPEDVINNILASCDGWMSEAGDGTISLTVGVYREPTDPPLTEADIVGFSFTSGQTDEQIVNLLNVSFTDPSQKFVSAPRPDVRDEDSISLLGVQRPKPLSLPWVQSGTQADRLGQRALSRLNPKRSGTLYTRLTGLEYLGKRWIKVKYPPIADLADCVIEVQPNPKIDLKGGIVAIPFNLVDLAKLQTDSVVTPPPIKREDGTPLLRADGSLYLREAA